MSEDFCVTVHVSVSPLKVKTQAMQVEWHKCARVPNESQWPIRTVRRNEGWFYLTSLAPNQRPRRAWEINSFGLRRSEAKPSISQKLLCTILWNAVEDNGNKILTQCRDDSGFQMLGEKKALQSGESADDHHDTAIYLPPWYTQLLILKN